MCAEATVKYFGYCPNKHYVLLHNSRLSCCIELIWRKTLCCEDVVHKPTWLRRARRLGPGCLVSIRRFRLDGRRRDAVLWRRRPVEERRALGAVARRFRASPGSCASHERVHAEWQAWGTLSRARGVFAELRAHALPHASASGKTENKPVP